MTAHPAAAAPAPGRLSLQTTVQAQLDDYPPSMRRVADTILARPQLVLELTISELARRCHTSETSIVRFCRTLEVTGYAQLKLLMAAELASESAQRGAEAGYGSDILPGDSLADTVQKITAAELLGIQETAKHLDLDALGLAIDGILGAQRIVLFGVGASGAGAHDLAQKLQRIGRIAFSPGDAHEALTAAALLGPGDVAIGFSHSGRTREVVELFRVAGAGGATTVCVTNVAGSPAARAAAVVLRTAVRETTFRSGAMASRIAQLAVVDFVFVGVAQANHEQSVEALKRTGEGVRGLRGEL